MQGPELRAVLELNPSALAQAAELDQERKQKGKRSDLHGIPILLKVSLWQKAYHYNSRLFLNLNRITLRPSHLKVGIVKLLIKSLICFQGMNTTAGSFSLLKSVVPEDAGVVKRLRAAGAIILGMTALLHNYCLTAIL